MMENMVSLKYTAGVRWRFRTRLPTAFAFRIVETPTQVQYKPVYGMEACTLNLNYCRHNFQWHS